MSQTLHAVGLTSIALLAAAIGSREALAPGQFASGPGEPPGHLGVVPAGGNSPVVKTDCAGYMVAVE